MVFDLSNSSFAFFLCKISESDGTENLLKMHLQTMSPFWFFLFLDTTVGTVGTLTGKWLYGKHNLHVLLI